MFWSSEALSGCFAVVPMVLLLCTIAVDDWWVNRCPLAGSRPWRPWRVYVAVSRCMRRRSCVSCCAHSSVTSWPCTQARAHGRSTCCVELCVTLWLTSAVGPTSCVECVRRYTWMCFDIQFAISFSTIIPPRRKIITPMFQLPYYWPTWAKNCEISRCLQQ